MSHILQSKKTWGVQNDERVSRVFTERSLKRIIFEHRPQVQLNFYCIVTMKKVAVTPTASKYGGKRIIDKLDRAKDVTSYSMNNINKCFEELSE